ncbi:MAG: hypothetical protein N5P05_001399 [Chroococcopsis gigantea SAG 12.99]|jgi:hypothetical protein|nr:hypothetical protein [Chlorogloea purpurea SAG 13.99]MDV2999793.1 hypothetical protein [Chroococcopsis gigantea SAG 12.99]
MKRPPVNVWLSLATAPFLLGYLGVKNAQEWLIKFGESSEEVFRGERLPLIDFRDQPSEYEE